MITCSPTTTSSRNYNGTQFLPAAAPTTSFSTNGTIHSSSNILVNTNIASTNRTSCLSTADTFSTTNLVDSIGSIPVCARKTKHHLLEEERACSNHPQQQKQTSEKYLSSSSDHTSIAGSTSIDTSVYTPMIFGPEIDRETAQTHMYVNQMPSLTPPLDINMNEESPLKKKNNTTHRFLKLQHDSPPDDTLFSFRRDEPSFGSATQSQYKGYQHHFGCDVRLEECVETLTIIRKREKVLKEALLALNEER